MSHQTAFNFLMFNCLERFLGLALISFYFIFQGSFGNQAIPAMPYSKSQRFDLGSFMKTRKEMRQKAVEESRAMKTELSTINRQINRLKSKVNDARGVLCDITNQNENVQFLINGDPMAHALHSFTAWATYITSWWSHTTSDLSGGREVKPTSENSHKETT